ncbi:MAG: hypothetical protein GXP30_04775 [Verrucomicrobia bacterium]|nr:hypothetical protein [Verrucomicrobiota bacterium]
MRCPRCSKSVTHRSDGCHSCGYSITDAQAVFGTTMVEMDRLHDAAHCLRKEERAEVLDIMDRLKDRFPQLFFCAYLGTLPDNVKMSELGFWLLNHAAVKGVDIARPNENAILLLLDTNTGQAGISLGYYIEKFLDDVTAARCLGSARSHFVKGENGKALGKVMKKLGRALSKRSRNVLRIQSETSQSVLNPFGASTSSLPVLRNAKMGSPLVNKRGERAFS